MLHHVIGVPTIDQFVEPVILDVSSLVSKLDATFDGSQIGGERGHPHPIADERLALTIELALYTAGFQ